MSKATRRWMSSGVSGAAFVLSVLIAAPSAVYAAESAFLDVESLAPSQYCEVAASQYLAGAVSQAYGSARELKDASPELLENYEHGIALPKDGIYVHHWKDYTEAQRDFVRLHVLLGYDAAARMGHPVSDKEAWDMHQDFYLGCLEQKKAEKHADAGDFIRVEALENVAPSQRFFQCQEWLSDYEFIGSAVKHGRDCDQMKQWTHDTEGVQDERRAKIIRIVNEACAAKNIDAWFEGYAKRCMDGTPDPVGELRTPEPGGAADTALR